MTSKTLNRVKRLRWIMRQKSRLVKVLRLPATASIECPFCRNTVNEGDFFCCSELEQMWELTKMTNKKNEKKTNVAPVLAENLIEISSAAEAELSLSFSAGISADSTPSLRSISRGSLCLTPSKIQQLWEMV